MRTSAAMALLLALLACRTGGGAAGGPPPARGATAVERLTVRIVARYPHDPSAWTQGLLWHQGKLYESTGLVGASSLRRVDLESGAVEAQVALPDGVFGEGLALAGDRLIQLTWRDGRAFYWDVASLSLLGEKGYMGEGWGLAWDGERLLQSEGTSWLKLRDAATFSETGRLPVTLEGQPQSLLNELEMAEGALYANVWSTDEIVRIDPQTGRVTARIDASVLRREATTAAAGRPIDVLNGIAWRPERRTFLLTGKLWPLLFEVELVPAG